MVKNPPANAGDIREVDSISWRMMAWQFSLVFLPREAQRQRRLGGFSPYGLKELDTTEAT